MLSAAGETAQLVISIHASYWLGMCLSLILSWLLAFHISSGLAWSSMVMLVVYIFVVAAGLFAPQADGAVLYKPLPIAALSSGLCYSGFNAALLLPVVRRSSLCPAKKRRDIFLMSILSMGFLAAGIAVFQRNPGIIDAPMPFVKLLNRFGIWGYLLSACCLYTAALSTLTSCLRMLGRSVWSISVIILVASLGFTRIVDLMYTTLGGACALIILMAKFRNCSRKAFISSSDML